MSEHLINQGGIQQDLVYMAAHELKSPVTVLKAYVQMMSLKMNKAGQTDYLGITEKMDIQLDKLLNIIADLQDVTQITSGSLNYHFAELNIHESLRNCTDVLKLANPEVEIEFSLCSPDPVIKADKDRIEQVITNLTGNALKYSGSNKYLRITSTIENGNLKVCVGDKGEGISPEKLPYVFERFFRAGSADENKLPGLGLGLFICKEIISGHHGEIGVNSKLNEGSEFWFSLPLRVINQF
jgi:signal transduction histidine kinase